MNDLPKKFIFSMTTGHTGTTYMANLMRQNLSDAEVWHEILGYDRFGVDTPDISHLTLFNSQGNIPKVKSFWKQKLNRIAGCPHVYYGETSHILMKAGLMENISYLFQFGVVHILCIKRDMFKVVMSFRNRFEFKNKGDMWLWYLDPDYPRKIVSPAPFLKIGINGVRLWYICEIMTRSEYYKLMYKDNSNIVFHDLDIRDMSVTDRVCELLEAIGTRKEAGEIIIPERKNVTRSRYILPEKVEKRELDILENVIQNMKFDPAQLAYDFYKSGHRLG